MRNDSPHGVYLHGGRHRAHIHGITRGTRPRTQHLYTLIALAG